MIFFKTVNLASSLEVLSLKLSDITAQLQISVAYFCSIGYIFLFNA